MAQCNARTPEKRTCWVLKGQDGDTRRKKKQKQATDVVQWVFSCVLSERLNSSDLKPVTCPFLPAELVDGLITHVL